MSGASIKVDDGAVLGALDRLIQACGHPEKALENVGEYGRRSTIARIEREVTPEGSPFAPLHPLYALTKKGKGILRGESNTLSKIAYQLGGDGQSVAWGTNAEYGAIHQFGGVIKPKTASALVFSMGGHTIHAKSVTIPARPYLGVNDEDRTSILKIFNDMLQQAIDRSGKVS